MLWSCFGARGCWGLGVAAVPMGVSVVKMYGRKVFSRLSSHEVHPFFYAILTLIVVYYDDKFRERRF